MGRAGSLRSPGFEEGSMQATTESGAEAPGGNPRNRVRDLITGAWATQVIHHGVKFEVFDALARGPVSSKDIAAATGADPDGMFRLLRGIAALGLARHVESDVFAATSEGRLLCRDAPASLRGIALHWGERIWKSFETLNVSVVSGKASVASGADDFVTMQSDQARSAVFNRAMAEQSLDIGREVAQAYDFSGCKSVMDVGGGLGAVLRALLEHYPDLRGSVMDLPMIAEQSLAYLHEAGVGARAQYHGGNFFSAVPAGADAYVLKYIVHDWNDENAIKILENCRHAAGAAGRVLLIEQIVPETVGAGAADQAVIRGDLIMMTVGGKERTAREYDMVCSAAGLRIAGIHATPSGFSIIDARPA